MKDDLQFYPTPKLVTIALIRRIGCPESVFDPCAGDGAIISVCQEYGIVTNGIEIDPGRAATARVHCGDGLASPWGEGTIVMNPPFTRNSWHPWIERASARAHAWCLLPLSVLSAAKHLGILWDADILIYPKRIAFTGGDSYTCNHAWFGIGRNNRHGKWSVLSC